MRRLPLLATLLTMMLLLVGPLAAFADAAGDGGGGGLVLAVEGEPVGPEPAERTAEDNAARTLSGYEDRELPFTWGAAWLLSLAGLVGVVALGGLYQLLVRGPAQKAGS